MIGPNAILQLIPPLDHFGGRDMTARMLAKAGVAVPDGSQMIAEDDAARLHQLLRRDLPDDAAQLATEAGRATANYILAHRIPTVAQALLMALPAPLAARALSKAIAGHAWTFAGSGRFHPASPWVFEIADNPIVRGEVSAVPLCHWHAAVFARLYQALVHPDVTCQELTCCATRPHTACRFQLAIGKT